MAFMWTLLVGLVACRAYQRHHARPGDKLVARLHHETFSKSDGVVSPTSSSPRGWASPSWTRDWPTQWTRSGTH